MGHEKTLAIKNSTEEWPLVFLLFSDQILQLFLPFIFSLTTKHTNWPIFNTMLIASLHFLRDTAINQFIACIQIVLLFVGPRILMLTEGYYLLETRITCTTLFSGDPGTNLSFIFSDCQCVLNFFRGDICSLCSF